MRLAWMLAGAALVAPPHEEEHASPYRLFLDGQPFSSSPSLRSGNVIWVGNLQLTIGEPGEYRFRSAREGVLLELRDGGTRWVAVRVERTYDDGPGFVDGLAPLSEDEVRGLWGLRAETWNASCVAKAPWLDATRVFVKLGQTSSEGHDDLPALPAGLRRLEANRFVGWRNLARLRDLELLDVMAENGFDLRLVAGFHRLRSLEVYAESLKGIDALGTLRALEDLELRHQRDVDAVAFARKLPALRHIGLNGTTVADLSPLSGLTRLETIVATFAPLTRLPDGPLPALRSLDVMLTPLTDDAVAAFRRAHPGVRVRHRWNASLREALAGTTKVRLRPEAECTLDEEFSARDVEDASDIAALMAILVFDEKEGAGVCGCLGGTSIEFHRRDGGVESLQLVCGVSIRWSGWPGDGEMSDANQQALVDWLARHGVTGPRDELREARAGLEAYARKQARAAATMSPRLRAAFERGVDFARQGAEEYRPALQAVLAAELPRAGDRIAVLLRVLGAEMGSWNGLDGVDQVADDLLRTYTPTQLERAGAAALRGDDRQLRRGAARFWGGWESPVPGTLADDATLRSAILTAHQESRSPEVRQRAQRLLQEWWPGLPADERDRRLLAGLHDPSTGVRRRAILVAGETGASAAEGALAGLVGGHTVEVSPLPPVPPEEEDTKDMDEDVVVGDSTEAELAAVALGRIRAQRTRP